LQGVVLARQGRSRKDHVSKQVEQLDRVIIRFAGDSGDGMQLTGDRSTAETATSGNDLATLPNFPAEIRAPQGTMAGVSSFQVHFADHDILTPGDTQAPIGIFRQVERPTYDDLTRAQVDTAVATTGPGDLAALIAGRDTWAVGEPRG